MSAHIYRFCRLQLQYFPVSSRPLPAHFRLSPTIWISSGQSILLGFPGGSDDKESTCNTGDLGLTPGLERSPGGRHGNPLQYSCLGNPSGQKSLGGLQLMGSQRAGHDWVAKHRRAQSILLLLVLNSVGFVHWQTLSVCLKSEVKEGFCQQPRTSVQSWMACFSSSSRTCPHICAKYILTPTLACLLG